ncbi:unnamed protein product [Arctogadus glacialis]
MAWAPGPQTALDRPPSPAVPPPTQPGCSDHPAADSTSLFSVHVLSANDDTPLDGRTKAAPRVCVRRALFCGDTGAPI